MKQNKKPLIDGYTAVEVDAGFGDELKLQTLPTLDNTGKQASEPGLHAGRCQRGFLSFNTTALHLEPMLPLLVKLLRGLQQQSYGMRDSVQDQSSSDE